MTFRARLLVSALAAALLTTVVSLIVAQQQNSAAYTRLGDELLDNQVQAFERLQQSRNAQAQELAARLAESVRLFAALEARDPEVYKIADDELRLGEFALFRLLDERGELIAPPDGAPERYAAAMADEWLVPVATHAAQAQGVQLGIVEMPTAGGRTRAHRLLAAPIRSFDRLVGTLLLGQPVAGMVEAGAGDGDGPNATMPIAHSALWLDNRLVGGNVPAAARTVLASALENASQDAGELRAGASSFRFQRTLLNPGSVLPPAHLISLVSMDSFEADQRALALRIVATGIAAALVAALIAYALSRQLSRPVDELVNATDRIREGDYAHRLGPSRTREFDRLARAFNQMAADLGLKDRYHSVLKQVTDREVAEELIAGRVKLGGELRDVTVMFCDIRGYTAIARGRGPEEVIELLNGHLGALSQVVHAYRGVINQFAGDSIMALFGAPRSHGDDASRAVDCACAMIEVRERLNAHAPVPIQVGIGLASGPMVAGCIGAEQRSDYTVVGERVNLAARLSAVAGAGEVLVDATTRDRLDVRFEAEPMPPQNLKGFGSDMAVYRVRLARGAA